MPYHVELLSEDVINRLRTGINLTSIAHCVEELVLNSVDAGANCIAVHLNLPVYQIQVIDNGTGIDIEQMEMVGKRYATSKCHTLEDLQNLKTVGFRGEALASLKEVCSILMIESRSSKSRDTYCKIFTQGAALSPKKSINARPSRGTTISVYDFMYNMPVRRNSFSAVLDLEESRKIIQAIALMHPNLSFSLKNETTGETILQLRRCSSLYSSFLQIFGKRKSENLKEVSLKKDNYEINGYINTECIVSKDLQFLFVNKRLVLQTKLHKLINNTLNKALGSRSRLKKNSPDGCSPTKSQAQCCVFVLNLSCKYDKYDIIFEPRKTMIEFYEWDEVIILTENCLADFLKKENLLCVPEGNSAVTTDVVHENIKTSTIDPHDYKQALFSQAVRRLQINKDPEIYNVLSNERSVNNIFQPPVAGTSKALNYDASLKHLSINEPDVSILDSLKEMPSKSSNSNHCTSLPKTITSKDNFNVSDKNIFPTKNPIMLNISVKSTLSELQPSSRSLDLLSKLKEKFQFSPVKRTVLPQNKRKQNSDSCEVITNTLPHFQVLTSHHNVLKNHPTVPGFCDNAVKSTKDKSLQCPSISIDVLKSCHKNTQRTNINFKSVKDKSLQCPSISISNRKRSTSRFYEEESIESFTHLQGTDRYNCHSSKNLIQECISVVEDLLNDAADKVDLNKKKLSVFTPNTSFHQQKSVQFENHKPSNIIPTFKTNCNHLSSKLTFSDIQFIENKAFKNSVHKNKLRSNIADSLKESPYFSRPVCAYWKTPDENVNSDSASSFNCPAFCEGQNSLVDSSLKKNSSCHSSPCCSKKEGSIFTAESSVPHFVKTSDLELPESDFSENVEISLSLSSTEGNLIMDEILSNKAHLFKSSKISQEVTKDEPMLNHNSNVVNVELKSIGIENLWYTGDVNIIAKDIFCSSNVNDCLYTSPNIATEVSEIINTLVNKVVDSIDAFNLSLNNVTDDYLQANCSMNSVNEKNSTSDTEGIQKSTSSEFINDMHISNINSLEKGQNFKSNFSSCDIFRTPFSETIETSDFEALSSNDVKVNVSVKDKCLRTEPKINHSEHLGINIGHSSSSNVTSSKTASSVAELKESNNLNLESDNLSLDIPFSELVGIENKLSDEIQEVSQCSLDETEYLSTVPESGDSILFSKDCKKRICLDVSNSYDKKIILEKGKNTHESFQSLWEAHLEPATKKTVYINPKTGNSTYTPPFAAEQSVDGVSNLWGGAKKSHFFLSHDFSPFVSTSQTPEIEVSKDLKNNLKDFIKNSTKQEQNNKWRDHEGQIEDVSEKEFQNLFTKWENPMFEIPYEVDGVGVSKALQNLPQVYAFLNSYKFSKDNLKYLEVIGQVDCKFIAAILKNFSQNSQGKLLVLFDQHAVHERVRLEEILDDLYDTSPKGVKLVRSESLSSDLRISLDCEKIRLLKSYQDDLLRIGIKLAIDNALCCSVHSVPSCLVNKKTKDLRRSQADTIIILQNAISEWLSSVVKTRSIPQMLPKTLISVVNYQACRGAVKFGDPLTLNQCRSLLAALSKCQLPFQCAHGRPSIAPILDLKKVEPLYKKRNPPQLQKLSELAKYYS